MKVSFTANFTKDVSKIRDAKLLFRIKEIILNCKQVGNVASIQYAKKLHGHDNFFRIRIGEWRIGIKIINDEIRFMRCLQRKDIYRYFP